MVCIFFLPGTKGVEANKRRQPEAGTYMWNLEQVWRKDFKGSVSLPLVYQMRLHFVCFGCRTATLSAEMQRLFRVFTSNTSWPLQQALFSMCVLKSSVGVAEGGSTPAYITVTLTTSLVVFVCWLLGASDKEHSLETQIYSWEQSPFPYKLLLAFKI